LARRAEIYFVRVLASLSKRPSVDTTNGVKVSALLKASLKRLLLLFPHVH
jgi:hypothetical protein